MRQVTHALLTRPPLSQISVRKLQSASFDLHVLSTPPAFILSQDQTLLKNVYFVNIRDFAFAKLEYLLSIFVWFRSQDSLASCFRTVKPLGFTVFYLVFVLWIFFSNFQGCITVYLSKFMCLAFVFYQTRNVDILSQALRFVKTFF